MKTPAFLASSVAFGLQAILYLNGTMFLYAQRVGSPNLPPGDGRELIAVVCTQCHQLRTIFNWRDGREGWKKVVEDMVLRGAQMTPEEVESTASYLFKNFGPGSQLAAATAGGSQPSKAISLPPGPGKELVETRCTTCHDLSRVVSLRKVRQEWEQITADMISRGAQASDPEAEAIVSYLTAHFGN